MPTVTCTAAGHDRRAASGAGDDGPLDVARAPQGGPGQGAAAGGRRGGHQRGGPALSRRPTNRCGPGAGASRPRASTASAGSPRVADAGRGCPTGTVAAVVARHPARGARRRLDALDDADDGRALRDRQGHRRPDLAATTTCKPWKVDTFKVSNDPHFEEKLVDVVGLYMNPPERAVVFSFDEKTQVQALDRTQPSLPMKRGRGGTMTHDYKRHGTTDLFAAMNVATGEVLYDTKKRHTADRRAALLQAHRPPRPERTSRSTSCSTTSRPTRPRRSPSGSPHPEARALAPALHADQLVVAQPRRALVRRAHRASAAAAASFTSVDQLDRGDRAVGRALERRPEALRLAQAGRGDHREGPSRTGSAYPSQIRDGPLA